MDVIVFGEIGQVALDIGLGIHTCLRPIRDKIPEGKSLRPQCIKGDFFHHVQRRHSHVVAIFSGILTKPNPCAGLGKHRDPFGLPGPQQRQEGFQNPPHPIRPTVDDIRHGVIVVRAQAAVIFRMETGFQHQNIQLSLPAAHQFHCTVQALSLIHI